MEYILDMDSFGAGMTLGLGIGIVLSLTQLAIKSFVKGKQAVPKKPDLDKSSKKNCKLIIAVRTDLKIPIGKMAAHCAHASVAALESGMKSYPKVVNNWIKSGQMKVTVKINSDQEMDDLVKAALLADINTNVIKIVSLPGPHTYRSVVALGPAPVSVLNPITGHLKLF